MKGNIAKSTKMLMLVCCSLVLLNGCSKTSSEFEGRWQSRNMTMTITRAGDTFVVDLQNPTGLSGKFVGTPMPAGLKVNVGRGGEQLITYNKDSSTLSFVGETFVSVR